MKENYLLKTDSAVRLYREHLCDLPIIDFHNHVSVKDIKGKKRYSSLTEIWLSADPYKHRLMRICGIPEYYITGDAEPYQKLERFFEIFPRLAGTPVYDWSRMELSRIFGIDGIPTSQNARYVYDKCGEMLSSEEFTCDAILSRFGIEYQSPVATAFDELSDFDGVTTASSLRGDELLSPTAELYKRLGERTGIRVTDTDSYVRSISLILDSFSKKGCKFADHALDDGFFSDGAGEKRELLIRLGNEYAKRGWTLLLHLGAKRQTSQRLKALAGAAGGYAATGGGFDVSALCDTLGEMEAMGGLPDTVLFPLNMNDQAPISVMQGSFSEDGTPSKVQLGPAWWWCDHAMGIENTLECISSFGVLSEFIGMTTDSRSILSFVRHDYFRRIFASYLTERNDMREWELTESMLGEIGRRVCYENAKSKILKVKPRTK